MPLSVPGVKGAGAGRRQVALKKGHSLMDWVKLTQSKGRTLGGLRGRPGPITVSELARHATADDCWMALRGKVFNVTPYMNFHPGGVDELLRAAGGDGTKLFDDVHPWVNIEAFLSSCLVGFLVPDSHPASDTDGSGDSARPAKATPPPSTGAGAVSGLGVFAAPKLPGKGKAPKHDKKFSKPVVHINGAAEMQGVVRSAVGSGPCRSGDIHTPSINVTTDGVAVPSAATTPAHNWYQTATHVVVEVYRLPAPGAAGNANDVSVDVDAQALQVGIPVTGGCYYKLVLVLAHPVKTAAYSTKRTKSKLTLKLGKEDATLQWALLGNVVLESCERVSAGMVSSFTSLELASVYRVTHDTRLFRLRGCCGSGSDLSTLWGSGEGLGRHVRMGVGGEDASAASRSYTVATLLEPPLASDLLAGSHDANTATEINAATHRHLDLIIKIYPNGAVTGPLDKLKPGERVHVSPLTGGFVKGIGGYTNIGMICGGTGITPMLSLIQCIRAAAEDARPAIQMLACNREEKDILLRHQLERLQQPLPFTVHHVLSQPPSGSTWDQVGSSGRLTKDVIKKVMATPGAGTLVFVCGRPAFNTFVAQALAALGFQYHIFG